MAIWGSDGLSESTGKIDVWRQYQGGISPSGTNKVNSITIRGAASGDGRMALYSGGTVTDLSGAVLIEEFAPFTFIDNELVTIPSVLSPVLPDSSLIWLVIKSDSGTFRRNLSLPNGDITNAIRAFDGGLYTDPFPPIETEVGSVITVSSDIFIDYSPVTAGPTLTGPDSTTDGTNTVETGTLLDTVTIQSLISGSYEVIQSIGVQTPATLEYIANSGVNDCVPGTPVNGVPLEATITATGITPYVVQQKVDDGVNPPTTRDITLNAPATHDVIQTMIASANTIDDQSIFGTSWIDVEDDMQAYAPKQVDGVNFTWNFDGTFTTDQDKTVNVRVPYFAPSTGQHGCIDFTIQGTSIVSGGIIEGMITPLIDSIIESV